MSTPANPQALSIAEAASRLGVHRQTLRAAIRRGELPAARLGRRWLVPVAALDRLLAPPLTTTHDREAS
ncbi:MAG: helix-turn-helix domain-containing protein [Acidimicrobiales bacterium]|jgi:excisionase family DNA binding protein